VSGESGRRDTGARSSGASGGTPSSDRRRRPGWQRDAFLQAGFLVGAAAGAAATVLGRRFERSARRGLIDWRTAERLAAGRVRSSPGSLPPYELARAEPIYASAMAEIVPALSRALDADLPGVVGRSAVVSREEWVHANISTFARLMNRIEGDLIDQVVPPDAGLIKSAMAIANRMVATRQVAFLIGFLGQRVLGQYDLALISAELTPGRLLFVDENIRRMAAILGVPLNPFRTWIALHETTHAFEFEAHPWLRPYLSERLERQLEGLSGGISQMGAGGLGRITRSLRGQRESWVEGLMTAEQRREFREIQAVMSLMEGFGDYIMDEVGVDLVPDVETISARFHARREQRTGFERAMMRITGMDIKMEQYKKGEEFVRAVARAAGPAGLSWLWLGPEQLPKPEEIDEPTRWLRRVRSTIENDVHGASRPPD
jgi:coenzyme F420 biosynthesis associated uncharacterized protein